MPALTPAGITGYIGPLGRQYALPVVSALSRTDDRPSQLATTLSGRRVAFTAPAVRRGWAVTVQGARPEEIGGFVEMMRGDPGPHWWVSPLAQVTNVLTPGQADLLTAPTGATARGGFDTGDGWAPRSVVSSQGGALTFGPAPILPGSKITVSAYVNAPTTTGYIGANFYSQTGAQLTNPITSTPTSPTPVRQTITLTAPTTAYSASVYVITSAPVARPCLTWTPEILPWSVGNGCDNAVITSWSANVRATYAQSWAPRTQEITFNIDEVN